MARRGALIGWVAAAAVALAVAGAALTTPDTPSAPPRADEPASPSATEPATPRPPAGPTLRPGPPVLQPNLRSTEAADLHVEVVGTERRLRFAATLANTGQGPLVLVPRGRGRCPRGQHSARQLVHVDADDDGAYRRSRDTTRTDDFAGCMLRHLGHDHWHFDAMAAYALRRPGTRRPLAARDKVSFCLRDNVRVPTPGRSRTVPRAWFGDCTATTRQGISPGWADVYDADLDGQWLRVPRGVDGDLLCLDLTADPDDLVAETSEVDNATSVALRISGDTVRRVRSPRCVPRWRS